MKNIVDKTIIENKLLEGVNRVIVAFSGGADSAALLHYLFTNRDRLNISVCACHLNHQIRGEEALRDEKFVTEFCRKNGIRLFLKSVDVVSLAKKQKISLELCGRNERYLFFEQLTQDKNTVVATAHTASDNAETLLFNITRGCGLKGLCAIPYKRENIIRPLRNVTREQIEKYCEENKISFITDSTNLTDDYTRNNIRHNVVPVLKEINPDVCGSILRLCQNVGEVNDFLQSYSKEQLCKAQKNYGFDSAFLARMPSAVLKNAIIILFNEYNLSFEQTHVELCADIIKHGGELDLKDGFKAINSQNLFRIINRQSLSGENNEEFVLPFNFEGEFIYDNIRYKIRKVEINQNVHKKFLNNIVSCDIINAGVVFRTRRSGDVFTFGERKVTKTVKKLFNEKKIPKEMRDKVLLLADKNTVLWIDGIGTSKQGEVLENRKFGYEIIRGYSDA